MKDNELYRKIERDRIYHELLFSISFSENEQKNLDATKRKLVSNINEAFSGSELYLGFKFIGSAATGNYMRGKSDIDGVIILSNFDKQVFRERATKISGLENIVFQEECFIVNDKVDARMGEFDVSIGCINGTFLPYDNLGADLLMHPEFTLNRISENQKKDILLTKRFFRNLGLYGAKVGGFAIEQIIAYFGNFDNLLKHLKEDRTILIDFSGKYRGPTNSMVVSYPYCGLDNLTKKVTQDDFKIAVNYARKIMGDPEIFLEDSRAFINRQFWSKRVKKLGEKEELSIPDIYLNRKENRTIKKEVNLVRGLRILDIGCANGYSTIQINKREFNEVYGVDVNEELIRRAQQLTFKERRLDIHYINCEMISLPFKDDSFDVIYLKRAISNLPSQRKQREAIKEAFRVLKRSGKLYVLDLFKEGYDKLNQIRQRFSLHPISYPYHCTLLTEENLENMISGNLRVERKEDFTSTYYLLSRVLYPKIADFLMAPVKNNSFWNYIFSFLPSPSIGSLGVNKLYVFRKNG